MELLEKLKVDFDFHDSRGSLTQLVHEGYKQVNVLFTRSGVERGGHFHKESNECFYVVKGTVQVTAKLKGKEETVSFGEHEFFKVKPFIIHSMYFPEDCILIVMYDKCVELADGSKDIYPI